MDVHRDCQKGLEWLAYQNRDLKLEIEKIQTQLFFYKKDSDESKQTITRILKNPNETGYIFLNESARQFLSFLLKENTRMNQVIKQSEFTANVVNSIEQERKINNLQNQIDILNDEISCFKQVKGNDEMPIRDLRLKVSSLSRENYHLKLQSVKNMHVMDYLQSTLETFQSNLVVIFRDLYRKHGQNFLEMLEENNCKFSECFSLSTSEITVEKREMDRLNAENNEYKRKITILEQEKNRAEHILNDVLESFNGSNEATLENQFKSLQVEYAKLEKAFVLQKKDNESLIERVKCFEKLQQSHTNDRNTPMKSPKYPHEPWIQERIGYKQYERLILVSDGGSVVRDGGSVVRDGGSVVRDGGSVVRDGGSVVRDGGSAVRDGGSAVRDGGSAVRDGGSAVRDGGSAVRDGGSAVRDGGRFRETSVQSQPDNPTANLKKNDQVKMRNIDSFETPKSSPTSPTKDKCVYCEKLYPSELLLRHMMECEAKFNY